MAKITGLGGAFFEIKGDMPTLLNWYQDILGLTVTEYGINIESSQETLVTVKRMSNDAYINFTVDNIESYLDDLKQKNVVIHKDIQVYPYGKFAQIKDLYGNIIELFEINPEEYKQMVLEEIKNYKNNHKK